MIYLVSKKWQGLSTNTERDRQDVAEEIKYIGNISFFLGGKLPSDN
jgi:hypothetical protein